MIIALDLDGVLYDWEGQARIMLEPKYGMLPVSTYWHYLKDRTTREDWNHIWKHKQMLLGGGQLIESAVLDQIKYIELVSGQLPIIITSRRPETENITREWLEAMRIPHAGLFCLGEKPKTSIGFDILLDDSTAHVSQAISWGRRAFLRDQPWNQRTDLPRVADLNDFCNTLRRSL